MSTSLTIEQKVLLRTIRSILLEKPIQNRDYIDVDWNAFLDLSKNHKVMPVIFKVVSPYIPPDYQSFWKEAYENHVSKINSILLALRDVTAILKKENIHFSVMKGLCLSVLLFDDIFARHTGDIDLLFNDRHSKQAFDLLSRHGYKSYIGVDRADLCNIEQGLALQIPFPLLKGYRHHEYFEMWKQFENHYVSVEIQRYLHETIMCEDSIETFIRSNTQINIRDFQVPTMDLYHTFLCLCENADNDGSSEQPILRNMFDIAIFLKKFKTQIDWNRLSVLADHYKMGSIVHQTLSEVNDLFGEVMSHQFKTIESIQKWKWNLSIHDRIFTTPEEYERERLKQHQQKTIQKVISRIEVFKDSHKEPKLLENFSSYEINADRFDLNLKFLFELNSNKLDCYIQFENSAYEILHAYTFIFKMLNNHLSYDQNFLFHEYQISWKEKNLFLKNGNGEDISKVEVVNIDGTKVMYFSLPFSDSVIVRNLVEHNQLVFQFNLLIKPYFHVYHNFDGAFMVLSAR
ncbi:nucleotidyltransferase family protein [Cohnella panacarvi]|uniref:nucleotidyltransferase family protein n=1 Tax=Cohnella panacarvi TaxID=400776 RepID=UPI00047E4089|nr:nucleotidyltransferase family protein [Cohnella panacarvi]